MTVLEDDKRRFQRVLYRAGATLTVNDEVYPCRVVDISLKGCLLEFPVEWRGSLDQLSHLTLELSDELAIDMTLSFAHGSGTQAGFSCEHIDIDSMTNLRRLVELNLGDSGLLERELLALTGS